VKKNQQKQRSFLIKNIIIFLSKKHIFIFRKNIYYLSKKTIKKVRKMSIKFNQETEIRVIKRRSSDGKFKIAETIDGNYAILVDNKIAEIYERFQNANAEFGRLTREE
jgi:hypothetical protein